MESFQVLFFPPSFFSPLMGEGVNYLLVNEYIHFCLNVNQVMPNISQFLIILRDSKDNKSNRPLHYLLQQDCNEHNKFQIRVITTSIYLK